MSDLIDRQVAIDALMAWEEDSFWDEECIKHRGEPYWVAPSDVINQMPSVQPEERTEERTKTHACDCISRQAAIDKFEPWLNVQGYSEGERNMLKAVLYDLKFLPSAQPEIIRCKDCKFWQDNNGGYPNMNCRWIDDETPDADDYCSYAERMRGSKE